jgi:ubiquinone/menaquinone biosynthesis C-methylase UbiE
MQNDQVRVALATRLQPPLTQIDLESVIEYRKRLYVSLWEKSLDEGLLDHFFQATTQANAEAAFGVEEPGKSIFTATLQILCKIGALRTYFDSSGSRVYLRTDRQLTSLPPPDDAGEPDATGQMALYQASQIPQITFRAIRDPNVRVQFSEQFEKWWRSVLEAKFYASGRDMSSHEIALPGSTVLDLACGLGHGLRELSAQVGPSGKVIGVEVADYHLEVSRGVAEELKNTTIFAGNLDDGLPMIESGSVDGVMITGAFHFMVRKEYLLSEIARVTKPRSKLVIGNCFMDIDVFDREYLDLFFGLIKPVARPIAPDVLVLLMKAYGFEVYFDYLVGSFGWYFAQKISVA